MKTHSDKTQENNKHSRVNEVSQKQSAEKTSLPFVDNRAEAVTQRKFQELANNSPQVKQAARLQATADSCTAQLQPLQKNAARARPNIKGSYLDSDQPEKTADSNNNSLTVQRKSDNGVVQRIMWYMSDDHSGAISKLAKENPRGFLWNKHTESNGVFGSSDLRQDDDSSITLWGHTNEGGAEFGGLSPEALVGKLIESGIGESKHTLVNIISCAPNMTYDKSITTYAQTVKSLLSKAVERAITVKTLPMVEQDMESILFRWERLDKIAYVTCPIGKMNDIMTTFRVYEGDYPKTVLNWRKKGFTVQEMNFSNILSKLVETVEVKTHKEQGDLGELLLPNVYGK